MYGREELEVIELISKEQADKVINAMEARIKELEGFYEDISKDCKWLPTTTHFPTINGFETMVLCTNGKKRVASFRMFDMRWYDVNNGNKLNVVKWLWQPSMPSEK